jgi:hypothetical protein
MRPVVRLSPACLLFLACSAPTPSATETETAAATTSTAATDSASGGPATTHDPTDGESSSGDSGGESSGGATAPGFDLPALAELNTDLLATSPVCAECHANADGATAMRDAKSRPIAPFDLWRATAMANSARDPFWWAMMSAEVAATPTAQAEIEATCLGCHAPMARVHNDLNGLPAPARADLLGDSAAGKLGIDGVACALCHQIQPAGLGTDASFTAGFVVEPLRQIYGPHASPFTMPMQSHTGFTPTQADHVTSRPCAAAATRCRPRPSTRTAPSCPACSPSRRPTSSGATPTSATRAHAGSQAAACGACHMPTRDRRRADLYPPRPPPGRHRLPADRPARPLRPARLRRRQHPPPRAAARPRRRAAAQRRRGGLRRRDRRRARATGRAHRDRGARRRARRRRAAHRRVGP